MYFFLNNFLPRYSSGIEHAEYKRLRLFAEHHVPAKIVTALYQGDTHLILPLNGLDHTMVVNQFDFFGDNEHVAPDPMTMAKLPIPADYRQVMVEAERQVLAGDRLVMKILMRQDHPDWIDSVQYFDGDEMLIRQDFYDTRGFKSFAQFFATTDDPAVRHLTLEQFYSHTGRAYYEITYRKRDDGQVATNYRVLLKDGRIESFMNPSEVYTLFLDELNRREGEGNVFISDRSDITNLPMVNMKSRAFKIEHFHNIHFADYKDPFESPLTYPSIGNTDQLRRTDLVLTPTAQQAADMRARLRTQVPIDHVPVGWVPDSQLNAPRIPLSDRSPNRIVIVARLYYEKHLDDAIWAFKQAHDVNPALTLDIYGYGDGSTDYKDEKLVKQIIEEQGLGDAVNIQGYTDDINAVYNDAQLMLLTSRFEGFVLAILEAAAHGVPTISYATHYGPAALIQPDISGVIVPYGDVAGVGHAITKLMSDDPLRQQLSDGAYRRAQDYSSEAVWQAWERAVIPRVQAAVTGQ